MASTDSILKRLSPDDAVNERRREELFQTILKIGLIPAVQWAKDTWDIDTSKSALGRFKKQMQAKAAEEQMLDTLAVRCARAKKMSAEMRGGRVVSPETLKALDQAIFEVVAIDPDSPRLERLAKILSDLLRAADAEQNTAIAVDKFRRETCEMFLKWFGDQKAREIAESNAPHEEKIKALRATYYADVDELEKSGGVVLPS